MNLQRNLKRLTMFGAVMAALMAGLTAQAQTLKLGKPVSGLYNAALTASGTDVVVLNDLEDHSWSYYSDGSTPDQLHSLNPADIKITYFGNGQTNNNMTTTDNANNPTTYGAKATGVQVSASEPEHTFVYFKTLERQNADGTGNLKYTTIPNPFQKRPTNGTGSASTTRTVYISWSCGTWNYSQYAQVYFVYTNASGTVTTSSTYQSNGNTTITARVGTTITVYARASRGRTNATYNPTITAKYDDNNGQTIVTYTSNGNTSFGNNSGTVEVLVDYSIMRGFYAWRIKSLSSGLTISGKSVGDTVRADSPILFVTSSSTGNEVEFEALWAQAYVTTGTSDLSTYVPASVTSAYERNFHVVTSSTTASSYQKSYPLTVSSRYPDGSNGGGSVSGAFTAAANTKFEDISITGATNATWTANNHDLIVGRGCTGTVFCVRGADGNETSLNYTLRLESGTYTHISLIRGYMTGSSNYTDNGSTMSGNLDLRCTLGCDYDRATNSGITNNLIVTDNFIVGYANTVNNANKHRETTNVTIKSGKIGNDISITSNSSYKADANQSIYVSVAGSYTYNGRRCIYIEGGELIGVAGGIDGYYLGTGVNNNNTDLTGITRIDLPSFELRMSGGKVRGAIYGGAAKSPGSGNRRMIFTGGTINGWIGGGCNGTDDAGGKTYGESFLYFGGNTRCEADPDHDYEMNGAKGGYVFGAGKGYPSANGTSGEMTYGTNLAIADNSYIQRNAFGGGNYGYALESTNVYFYGGTVGGNVYGGSNLKNGPTINIATKGTGTIQGGLYGGSNENGTVSSVTMGIAGGTIAGGVYGGGLGTTTVSCDVTGTVDITMTGGNVLTGLYGGGNVNSKINGKTTVNINGGTVGVDASTTANVYGGGLGELTRAKGSVEVNVGSIDGSGNTSGSAVIYGDVYGGSAKGITNCNDAGTSLAAGTTTKVTLNGGTINGSLYGGGHGIAGAEANVFGPVTVTVNGGKVKYTTGNPSSVFGCNNAAGSPKGTVAVTVNKTDATVTDGSGNKTYAINGVYGGGNEADYNPTSVTADNPSVTINGCSSSIKDVYGGGNAAAVPATKVEINGGDIDRVFGGGNGERGAAYAAHVGRYTASNTTYGAGNTNVTIHGGTVNQVFGGSNANGEIKGTINVTVENNDSGCPIAVGELYGGGNRAPSNVGNVAVKCMGANDMIGTLYCGSNDADVSGSINFTMTGGRIGNLFGGNNTGHTISGDIAVTVKWTTTGTGACENNYLGNVYGGGNLALIGTAENPKAPTVSILNGTVNGNVYGGGKGDPTAVGDDPNRGEAGKVIGDPIVILGESTGKAVVLGSVFGGGDAATVKGTPKVTVTKGNCNTEVANIYGGGNAADVDSTNVTVWGGTVSGDIYGGGRGDAVVANGKYADVKGNVAVKVFGGTVNRVFAGSNARGSITGTSKVTIEKKTGGCAMKITEVYGGGNLAAGNAGTIDIGCTGTEANGEGIEYVYGGANQANVNSDITLNITGGRITKGVFGGNNVSGSISGAITVNVLWGNTCENYLYDVYGGGNLATYTGSPTVNIKHGTVSHNVYGGGKGEPIASASDPDRGNAGKVTGNPAVNIGDADAAHTVTVLGNVFGGGDAATVSGTPVVTVKNSNTTLKGLYGGGNAADVTGATVEVQCGTVDTAFCGGRGMKTSNLKWADVTSNSTMTLKGGTIKYAFAGSNANGEVKGTGKVVLDNPGTSDPCQLFIEELYCGSNEATGKVGTVEFRQCPVADLSTYDANRANIGTTLEGVGMLFGGSRNADVTGDISLSFSKGVVREIFGGNNIGGSISGNVTVTIDQDDACWYVRDVYGGGYAADYGGTPKVWIKNTNTSYTSLVSGNVYGGGYNITTAGKGVDGGDVEMTGGTVNYSLYSGCNVKGSTEHNTKVQMSGGRVNGSVYGGACGANADVKGDTQVILSGNASVGGNVYGGGNAAPVAGSTSVRLKD